MPVPTSTSAEALDRYAAGKRTTVTKGPAWKDVRLTIMSLPAVSDIFTMPAVTEPFIAWISSGDAEAQEREGGGPWVTSRLQRNSLFLTTGGAPYDFRFKTLTSEPFEVILVILSLRVFNEALEEIYGKEAPCVRLRDLSGFQDSALTVLLQKLRDESMQKSASRLFVRGIAQAISVYLVRNYAVVDESVHSSTPSLPGFKLRRITEWMTENMADDFSLSRLAKQAGLSEFHFTRLFKRATGFPPLQYQIRIRMDAARRLLRESTLSVITIANQVGYSTPSHFAQVFRKETGLSPREYRQER